MLTLGHSNAAPVDERGREVRSGAREFLTNADRRTELHGRRNRSRAV